MLLLTSSDFNMFSLQWINYVFSGFIVLKLPFSLTSRFREMLQSGIQMENLDVSYVSAISWYFLAFFGLRGFISYFSGEDAANSIDAATITGSPMLAASQGMMTAPGQNIVQVFSAEREALLVKEHKYELQDAEQRLIKLLSGEKGCAGTSLDKKNE